MSQPEAGLLYPKHVLMAIIMALTILLPVCASAERTNFAKYQKVTASSQASTYAPDYAVDGLVSNYHSLRFASTGPHWLEVAYPQAITLGSAHLYLGLDNVYSANQVFSSFKLQYHDGAAWIDIPGSSVTGNSQTEVNLIFSQAVTSGRFRLWSGDSGNRIIRELAFFPPNVAGGIEQGYPIGTDVCLNLAYKRPATASSAAINNTYGPGFEKNAFDGYIDNLSRWVANNASGEYLEVDLLDTHVLGSAHLYTGFIDPNASVRQTSQPMPSFKLQSWNGTIWADIPGTNITGNTQVARKIEFTGNVSASKVRVVTTSVSNGRVQELLLFPPRVGGYALGREVIDASPPAATWDHFSDSSWRLKNSGPDLRLGLLNGTVVFASNSSAAAALNWQLLLNHRDGSYRICNVSTGQCLALASISRAVGTPIVAADYSGLPHQDWFVDYVDATQFRLINGYSGLAIRSAGSSWNPGTTMVAVDPNDGVLQRWTRVYAAHHPKKGVAATTKAIDGSAINYFEDSFNRYGGSWSYAWGRQSTDVFPYLPVNHTFNPMQWGGLISHANGTGPIDLLRREIHSNPKPVHVMGFNEPDRPDQADMSVDAAIERWPRLEAMEAPLIAPCPANTFGTWLPDWIAKADARGYRRDYTPYHWYSAPSSDQMISDLRSAYDTYGLPIWLTEFSPISWSGSGSWTRATNFNCLAEFMWRAESLPWLKRYSLYQFTEGSDIGTDPSGAPRGNARKADGSLTAYGELYAGWDAVTAVLPGKAYHLHNHGAYKRIRNPQIASEVSAVNPDTPASGCQWFLSPGTTEGTFQILSTRNGRPLRFYSGVPVSLASAGATATFTEWRLVPDQYGWYFIEHPDSNQRLVANANGTLTMGSIIGSGDTYKWRFVVPAVSEPASPPEPPSAPAAQPSTSEIALSWAAVPGADSYTVHRSTSATGPWQQMAAGLAASSWLNTGLPYETRYFYTVTATNGLGSSAPSGSASATTLHPFASYATWRQEKLGTLPPQDQDSLADPDKDGQSNLLEFAFLTEPNSPGGNPFKPVGSNGGKMTFEFLWNRRALGLVWQIRHGSDLTNVAAWPVVPPGNIEIVRQGDIDRITISPGMGYAERGFYVLEVTGN